MISNDELERLEKLCEAATPGEWTDKMLRMFFDVSIPFIDDSRHDADFCIASRTALPKLIAEVRRLREEYLKIVYILDTAPQLDELRKLRAAAEAAEKYLNSGDALEQYDLLWDAISSWRKQAWRSGSGGEEK